jgi:hypothetical protein
MEPFDRIVVLDNEVQARMLEAELRDRGIPHVLRSYHDSAYDGLFQTLKGWGHIEAPGAYRAEILSIVADLAGQAPPASAEDRAQPPPDESEGSP